MLQLQTPPSHSNDAPIFNLMPAFNSADYLNLEELH
jgi:hypothetical protein